MEAIVLAGGFGTRLQSMVSDVPKPMAPILGKPFLEYLFKYLEENKITRVILAVGYKAEIIKNYFGSKYHDMELIYSYEDSPLGTGGCIKKALELAKEEYVYIINGDTYFNVKLAKMTGKICIACKYMEDFSRYGRVLFDENNTIYAFQEKKDHQTGYINGGIYLFKKSIFTEYAMPSKFSLETDFFQKYMDKLKITAYLSDDYFIDIGIPDDYKKAMEDFKNV